MTVNDVSRSKDVSGTKSHGTFLGALTANLLTPIRSSTIDILIFNPPYVPTESLPTLPSSSVPAPDVPRDDYEVESHLLSLSYAGGIDGMETTNRFLDEVPRVLSPRGVAYLLLCAQNFPEKVVREVRTWGMHGKVVGGAEDVESVVDATGQDGNVGERQDEGSRFWDAEIVGRSGRTGGWENLVVVRIGRR